MRQALEEGLEADRLPQEKAWAVVALRRTTVVAVVAMRESVRMVR
jgi:hypothetical protein